MKHATSLYMIVILLVVLQCSLNNSVSVKFTNVHCSSNNVSWVRINQCRLKAISRYKVVFNFNATFLHSTNDIWVQYQMFKRASGYKPWLLDIKNDACQFLRRAYNGPSIMIYNLYRDFSNINHTCPMSGDVLIQNMYLRIEYIKLPFPTGDFRLSTIWSFYNRVQFSVNVSFQFVEDLIDQR